MEELQSYFEERFHLIKQSRELVNGDPEETQTILLDLNSSCLTMKAQLTQLKKEVTDWKQQVELAKRCVAEVQAWNGRSQATLTLIPQQALKKAAHEPSPALSSKAEQVPTSAVPKPRVTVGQVSYLTLEEFAKIPKYMKGRAQYETLTSAVDELNSSLVAKYTFMTRPLKELNPNEKKRRNVLRSQETPDTRGVSFVTAEELKEGSLLKNEVGRRTLLTILRHLHRIREIRGPGSLTRYAVVKM